ncbi:type II secretion system protein GspG [Bremerella sp. T1]|uniref:type II secretion system protein GspG n=1 Tax=Bremerella sp. TYQ1 TaxID=3119568 RepID=UPI001CCBC34C|nr:type II secretion system protein GspG [Bremerella volcania]UBM37543.1 type II secretion system protein GspG [Bremerella volcania]
MCSRPCHESNQCRHQSKPSRSNTLGAWGFGISLFGLLVTFGLLCPLGLLLSFFGLFSRKPGIAIAGVIIGGIGTAIVGVGVGSIAMAASAMHHYSVEVPKMEQTREVLDTACVEVESFRQENNKLPEGIEGNKLVLKYEDAYGNAVRYEPEEDGKFAIRSAGPDGTFDTNDDQRMLNSERSLNTDIAVHSTHYRGYRHNGWDHHWHQHNHCRGW